MFYLVLLDFGKRQTLITINYYRVQSNITTVGPFHANVNPKICRLEIVFDRLWYPLSILLLAAIGAKLIGPHGGLQVGEKGVTDVTASMEWPLN